MSCATLPTMRIVAVADTHSYQDHLGAVPDGDIFVHAGDLLQHGTLEELRRFTAWVGQLPHEHMVVIAGAREVRSLGARVRATLPSWPILRTAEQPTRTCSLHPRTRWRR